jgi:predicted KAP-like P-loop ATPase
MITENGYIETLDEQEAIEYGNYIEITEEIPKEVQLPTQEEIIARKEEQLLEMFEELQRLKGNN